MVSDQHFFGADDGIRTRDPHLGKVLGNVQVEACGSLTCGSVRHFVHCVHLIRACRSVRYQGGGLYESTSAPATGRTAALSGPFIKLLDIPT
jgi:hypothetical protein